MNGWPNRLRHGYRLFRQRRAAVAMAVTLATPMLIAVTGLTVDTSYWFQQQESLQSAADAAALSAAMNAADISTASAAQSITAPALTTLSGNAVVAANVATSNQFRLTAATVSLTTATPSTTTQSYTATATIPRGSFFSAKGTLFGIGAGFQNASATAIVKKSGSAPGCLDLTATTGTALSDTGGAKVLSPSCGINVASSGGVNPTTAACDPVNDPNYAIQVTHGGTIIGAAVTTAGCTSVDNGNSYLGGPNGNTSVVNTKAVVPPDPLLGLAAAPPWPAMPSMVTMPAIPTLPTPAGSLPAMPLDTAATTAPAGTTYVTPSLGYNTWSQTGVGDCTYQGSYNANCELYASAPRGYSIGGLSVNTLVMNQGTSSGTTYITNGIGGRANTSLTLNGSTYYIAGGFTGASGGPITVNGTAAITGGMNSSFSALQLNGNYYDIAGGASLSSGSVQIAGGTDYFTGAPGGNGFGTALSIQTGSNVTGGDGNYYLNGGLSVSNAPATFGAGNDYFYGAGGAGYDTSLGISSSNGSFSLGADGKGANTYYINGGATISNTASTTFGPGTYYAYGQANSGAVTGLGLNISSSNISAGDGNYYIDGGLSLSNFSTASFGAGTYYLTGLSGSSGVTGAGLTTSNGSFSLGADGATGSYYINGGANLAGTNASFGAGTFYAYGPMNNATITGAGIALGSGNLTGAGGTYYIRGGLTSNDQSISLGAGTYYLSGTTSATSGYINGPALNTTTNNLSLGAGTYYFNGGAAIYNAATTFGAGTYYFRGSLNGGGVVTNYAMTFSGTTFAGAGGTYYFNGGLDIPGTTKAMTFGPGTYLFNTLPGGANGAFDNGSSASANITFSGGTYYFDGGFTAGGGTHINFGPGIYYIRGGNLNFGSGSTVTATNATFVLEGTAGYEFNGGTAMTLSAPTQNANATACVEPITTATDPNAGIYPEAAYTLPSSSAPATPNVKAPYDGTGGVGICNVLIYQARGDSTADNIFEGANSTVTGIIYAPSAALNVSGGAVISASTASSSSGTLAFVQSTATLTGSGTINISLGTGFPGGGQTTFAPLLIN